MKEIAIYGAGGYGREVACLIHIINERKKKWNFMGFYDDGKVKGSFNEYGEILGGINDLNIHGSEINVVIAIANPNIVTKILKKITNPHIVFPNLIAPDILFLDEKSVTFGKGNIIGFNCIISCNVKIGDFNNFNGRITIGHDTFIGNYNSFMPSVVISGEVTIGDRNFFGIMSMVRQRINIGTDTTIGANSLILRNTKNENSYMGNPATIVKF